MPKFILVLVAVGLILFYGSRRLPPPVPNPAPVPVAAPQPAPVPTVRPPDLAMLAAGGGIAAPTPEQLAEERRMVDDQIAFAIRQLQSADVATRVEGAEQLSAYLGPASERRLVVALAKDPAAPVRLAAAHSLDYLTHPAPATLDALLAAVRDPDAEVRQAVLEVLENRLLHLEAGTKAYRRIVAGLRKLAKQRTLTADTRENIRYLLDNL